MKEEIIIELDNKWKVLFKKGERDCNGDIFNIDFILSCLNGDKWEEAGHGEVRNGSCCHLYLKEGYYTGYTYFHGCGRKDLDIFGKIYDIAQELMEEWQ